MPNLWIDGLPHLNRMMNALVSLNPIDRSIEAARSLMPGRPNDRDICKRGDIGGQTIRLGLSPPAVRREFPALACQSQRKGRPSTGHQREAKALSGHGIAANPLRDPGFGVFAPVLGVWVGEEDTLKPRALMAPDSR